MWRGHTKGEVATYIGCRSMPVSGYDFFDSRGPCQCTPNFQGSSPKHAVNPICIVRQSYSLPYPQLSHHNPVFGWGGLCTQCLQLGSDAPWFCNSFPCCNTDTDTTTTGLATCAVRQNLHLPLPCCLPWVLRPSSPALPTFRPPDGRPGTHIEPILNQKLIFISISMTCTTA